MTSSNSTFVKVVEHALPALSGSKVHFDAMSDIQATKECFFELKRRGIL